MKHLFEYNRKVRNEGFELDIAETGKVNFQNTSNVGKSRSIIFKVYELCILLDLEREMLFMIQPN